LYQGVEVRSQIAEVKIPLKENVILGGAKDLLSSAAPESRFFAPLRMTILKMNCFIPVR
jgi:hypothetical protein